MESKEFTVEALGRVMKWLDATEAFAVSEAPQLCEELLVYGWWSAIACLVVALLPFIALLTSLMIFRWLHMHEYTFDDHIMFASSLAAVISGILCVVGFAAIMTNSSILLQIHLAPRVYLLERISAML